MAKERPKIVAGLADLQRFEPVSLRSDRAEAPFGLADIDLVYLRSQLDENRLTNFAHALVDSRRSAAEALGLAFNRRTAK